MNRAQPVERVGFHCERSAHSRCVTRGCVCACHDLPTIPKAAPTLSPRPVVIDGHAIGANTKARPTLTEEERVARQRRIQEQRRERGTYGYSSAEIQALTELTYRQIDYWARTGVMVPSFMEANGSGTQRRWSNEDLRVLLVAKRLLDAGLSLASVRGVGEQLRDIPTGEGCFVLIDAETVTTARNLGQLRAELESGNVVHVLRIAGSA